MLYRKEGNYMQKTQMTKLQIFASQLNDIVMHYARQINNGAYVMVCKKDVDTFYNLLDNLTTQVKSYSEFLANSLTDIRRNLFIIQGVITFNPFRFGSLKTIVQYLLSNDFICNYAKYILTPWKDINEALALLLKDASVAKTRLEFNQVGVTARELYIMLAKKVYIKSDLTSDKGIGDADAKGMLNTFLQRYQQNEKVKKYCDAAISLAETVTHMKTDDKQRMDTLVTAVVSLIGLINSLHDNNDF